MPVPTRNVIYPIYSPARGLVLNAPGPFLDPRASPDAQNVRYYDQIVEKRTGYPSAAYAAGTITGVPIKLYTYTKAGVDYEMLATESNLLWRTTGDWASIKDEMTNTVTSRVTMCTMFNTDTFNLYFGSKETGAQIWTTVGDCAAITAAVVYKPKIMLPYQFRLL